MRANIRDCVEAQPDSNWSNIWEQGLCYDPFYRALYSNEGAVINNQSLQSSQQDFVKIFDRYLSSGHTLTEESEFRERLLQTCSNLPGVCDQALGKVCQPYTREEVESSPRLANFCGCFAPELQGEVRKFLINASFTYDRPCDPLCARSGTVKLSLPNGQASLCSSDVCVIDNVAINSTQNSNLPLVSFSQVCSCRENCRCVFDVSNTTETLNKLGLNYSLNQFCSRGSACVENGRLVPCVTSSNLNVPINKNTYYVLAFFAILFLLAAFFYFFISKR